MQALYRTNLIVHVVCGFIGLAVMAIPLVARKGARSHRRFGWVFAIAMMLAAFTGIVMSLAWMSAPALFRRGVPFERVVTEAVFLTLIGALTSNALAQAIFALRQKGRVRAAPSLLVRMMLALLAFCALLSLVLGIRSGDMLSLSFGAGSLTLLVQDLRFTFGAFTSPHAYLYQHINAMGTASISAVTAFVVLGARRMLGADALGAHAWLLWIAPALVLAPLFQLSIARHRHRLGRGATLARPEQGALADG